MSEQKDITRVPFMISSRTVALITLFHKGADHMEDMWTHDFLGYFATGASAAEQMLDQMGDHWTADFLVELRKAITAKLAEHDREFGTSFAERESGKPRTDARLLEETTSKTAISE